MSISTKYYSLVGHLEKSAAVPLLLLRLVLAYGFYGPAKMNWKDINSVIDWFGSIGIPAPVFNAYLAACTEMLGVVLLVLGLGTRLIAIQLVITMLVAIKTVHWANGFEAADNGFEIPLYYTIMLLTLLVYGPGKWSVDYLIRRRS